MDFRMSNRIVNIRCFGLVERTADQAVDLAMVRKNQREIAMRIVIEQPVVGVLHSLQNKNDGPLDAKSSKAGESLAFDFTVRVGPGPKFFGDQVRREGPERRFVYIRIGQMAGDPNSLWTRRMKIDIHDVEEDLLDAACNQGRPVEISIRGMGEDGTPACASVRSVARRLG